VFGVDVAVERAPDPAPPAAVTLRIDGRASRGAAENAEKKKEKMSVFSASSASPRDVILLFYRRIA